MSDRMSDRNYITHTYISNRDLLCKAPWEDLKYLDYKEKESLYLYRHIAEKIEGEREEIQWLTEQKGMEASIKECENNIARYNTQLSKMESEYPLRSLIQQLRYKEESRQLEASRVKQVSQEEQAVKEEQEEPRKARRSLREKLAEIFGVAGVVVYFVISLIIAALPFIMIGGNFFLNLLFIGLETFLPLTTVIFWIWGLVCAITGVQDAWAIIYYIVFAVVWIPFFISIIASFFKKK